jgi:Secretion system C-terminal sorting domain
VATGVGAVEAALRDMSVVPNPNSGQFRILGSVAGSEGVRVVVTDLLGQVVYRSQLAVRQGRIDQELTLGDVANGMYLLTLASGTESKTIHFVVGR